VRLQFICCCNKIQRTEREILDVFWRGRSAWSGLQ
jgi:hypothetical protein